MSTYEIPKHHRMNIIGYRSHLLPDVTYSAVPELVYEAIPTTDEITGTHLGDEDLELLIFSQLLYLREYAGVIYEKGASADTPAWYTYFEQYTDKELREACTDRAAGRKVFSALEKAMRYSPTTKLSLQILGLLKTAYTPAVRIPAVGGAGFYILNTVVIDVKFKEHVDSVRHTVAWKTYGEVWAQRFVQAHPDLSPGVYDEKGQAVKEGYVFLAQVLVNIVGLKKASAARVLGVHRLSIINWLEEGKGS